MTNESHNIWTLTKHLAGSANREAGKLDVILYAPHAPIVHVPTFFDLKLNAVCIN